jgi:hypothetical protein
MATTYEWLILGAILTGPIFAVQIQKRIETYREKTERRLKIFKTLFATRGFPLSQEHVQALNLIYLEFDENNKNDKKVVRAWNSYFDHLGAVPRNADKPQQDAWTAKKQEIFVDLLYEMGLTLGYDFDKIRLKKDIYVPQGHEDLELENRLIRKALLNILSGKWFFPVQVFSRPADDEPNQDQPDSNDS